MPTLLEERDVKLTVSDVDVQAAVATAVTVPQSGENTSVCDVQWLGSNPVPRKVTSAAVEFNTSKDCCRIGAATKIVEMFVAAKVCVVVVAESESWYDTTIPMAPTYSNGNERNSMINSVFDKTEKEKSVAVGEGDAPELSTTVILSIDID